MTNARTERPSLLLAFAGTLALGVASVTINAARRPAPAPAPVIGDKSEQDAALLDHVRALDCRYRQRLEEVDSRLDAIEAELREVAE